MNRKEFINRVSASMGAFTLFSFPGFSRAVKDYRKKNQKSTQTESFIKITEQRHQARWRVRRIIFNNDGNDVSLAKDEIVSREMFLSKRLMGLVGTQVDTVCYCTGGTFGGNHKSSARHIQQRMGMARCANEFDSMGTDALDLVVKFCHQHNIEVFWSHRMNDNHDNNGHSPELITEFKKNHPEYLMNLKGNEKMYDYAIPQVRAKLVDYCREVVKNYDVDGIELDFFRHFRFFKSVALGGVASDEEREMMNDMMRQLRTVLDDEGIKRGRPVLLSIRVPDSRAYSRDAGVDYEQWLKEDIVDLLIVNDYIKLEPWKNYPLFARQYGVPAYAAMEARRLSLLSGRTKGGKINPETSSKAVEDQFRSESYAAWLSGMNGIYTYNRFNPQDVIFRQIGDPRVLATMKVTPRESYGLTQSWPGMHYCNVAFWLKSGVKYFQMPEKDNYVRPHSKVWPDSDSDRDTNP